MGGRRRKRRRTTRRKRRKRGKRRRRRRKGPEGFITSLPFLVGTTVLEVTEGARRVPSGTAGVFISLSHLRVHGNESYVPLKGHFTLSSGK